MKLRRQHGIGSPHRERNDLAARPVSRGVARLAPAVAVAALIASCGALHPLTTGQSAVPWLPLPPDMTPIAVASPQAMPVPPGTPPCSLGDLAAGFIGKNGAGGHVLISFAFASRGTEACQLDGTATITLLDASGRDLGFKNRAPFFPDEVSGPALIEPGPAPILGVGLKYGEAGLTIDWVSQPEACPGEAGSQVAGVRIGLPGVGKVTVGVGSVPVAYACQGVGAVADPPLPVEAPAEPVLPNVTIAAPAQVHAGQQLRYTIVLTNPTKLPIDLRQACPNYDEELFADIAQGGPPLGGKNIYGLNCAAAGVLKPGTPMTFAMVLNVPADATPGSYTLVFNLGYANAMHKFARAAVAIA